MESPILASFPEIIAFIEISLINARCIEAPFNSILTEIAHKIELFLAKYSLRWIFDGKRITNKLFAFLFHIHTFKNILYLDLVLMVYPTIVLKYKFYTFKDILSAISQIICLHTSNLSIADRWFWQNNLVKNIHTIHCIWYTIHICKKICNIGS